MWDKNILSHVFLIWALMEPVMGRAEIRAMCSYLSPSLDTLVPKEKGLHSVPMGALQPTDAHHLIKKYIGFC